MSDHEERPACDFCWYEGVTLTEATDGSMSGEPKMLCEVCRNSIAGNAALHPMLGDYREHLSVLRMLAWVANDVRATLAPPPKGETDES